MKLNQKMKTSMSLVAAMGTLATANGALVGHWEFDNSVDVGQASVSDGLQAVGDAAYSASGKVGGALALDGTGDYLRVDGSHTLASGMPTGDASYTIALFMQTTQTGQQHMVTWGNGTTRQINAFRTITPGEFGGTTRGILNYNWGGPANGDYGKEAGGDIADGAWHHVAVTYDSGTSTKHLYFDGVELGSGLVVTNDLIVQGINFRIGTDRNGGNSFNGLIDDVRVYSDAQSASQIAALAAVPEPSAAALLGLGGLALILRRRK
jgi:hypothetical protein